MREVGFKEIYNQIFDEMDNSVGITIEEAIENENYEGLLFKKERLFIWDLLTSKAYRCK
ncbi:hypothetical protein [Enterococcus sp. AZ072]|uniref:hypothetical protein n=1 Tax=unclassified Enterococcus TaxID=2608891 RepID=UPI003D26C26D